MFEHSFTSTVLHRGMNITVHAKRGAKDGHLVTVLCKGITRKFVIGGKFGAELRNKAIEKFSGLFN